MGAAAAHQPRFRFFCCLLAAAWGALIVLSAVRLACASSVAFQHRVFVSPAAAHCPICGSRDRAGMKCCCHAAGLQSDSCRCSLRHLPGAANTAAVLVWSPCAVLPAKLLWAVPALSARADTAASQNLPTFRRSPLPRPPRLLGLPAPLPL